MWPATISQLSFSVRAMKSSTPRRSGRRSNTGSEVNSPRRPASQPSLEAFAAMTGFRELRRVLRRCPKEVLTMLLNRASSHPRFVLEFRVSLMTADCTFGGGANAPDPTVNRYSMSNHAWRKTDNMPYVLLPGFSAMRSATSF